MRARHPRDRTRASGAYEPRIEPDSLQQEPYQRIDALPEVGQMKALVRCMRPVVGQGQPDEDDRDPERPPQHGGRWDGPARAQERWAGAEPAPAGGCRRRHRWVGGVEQDRRDPAAAPDRQLDGRWQGLGEVAAEAPLDLDGVLVWYQADAELGAGRGGDDALGPGTLISWSKAADMIRRAPRETQPPGEQTSS